MAPSDSPGMRRIHLLRGTCTTPREQVTHCNTKQIPKLKMFESFVSFVLRQVSTIYFNRTVGFGRSSYETVESSNPFHARHRKLVSKSMV